jgi:hypothetical protein
MIRIIGLPVDLLRRVRRFVASWVDRHLVADVPDDLDACEECRELHCPQSRWSTCERRLGRIADLEEWRKRSQRRSA